MSAPPRERPPPPLSGRRVSAVLVGVLLGSLLSALDQAVVATALPTIAGELGGAARLSWTITAYLLVSTLSTPLWGALGDRRGRKGPFQLAVVIFLAASVWSGVSTSMGELIAARALLGLGGGGLLVGAQALVGQVAGPRRRARYQGLFGAVYAVTSVLGPLVGGVVTQTAGWRWIFFLNVPVGTAALLVTSLALPARHRAGPPGDRGEPGAAGLFTDRVFVSCCAVSLVTGFIAFGVAVYRNVDR